MSGTQGMINSIKQNRALLSSRKSFKSRKNQILQSTNSVRTYSEEEIKEGRERLDEKIKQNRRFKIVMLVLILGVTGFLIYSFWNI